MVGVVLLALGSFSLSGLAWARNGLAEIRRVGISRVGENTLLTVVLDRPLEGRVSTRSAPGKPQVVVEFPQARTTGLPARLAGDDVLVEQVRTETSPSGVGVRLTLDLGPDQPYVFWRQSRAGGPGQGAVFVLGLRSEGTAPSLPLPPPPETAPEPRPSQETYKGREFEAAPPPPAGQFGAGTPGGRQYEPTPPSAHEDFGSREPQGTGAPGSLAELRNLMPSAGSLLQWLEKDGWTVAESHNYDRASQRYSKDFILTNRLYPELVVKVANVPASVPNTPSINFITLSTERVGGDTARKYEELRQWNFAKIRQKYEDIGDFFDEALKPLRVKLREETKAVALRRATVFTTFLQRACRNPQVADKVMSLIREKVNPRFEGVQYTVSEDPLVLLNLVDFLYVRVYFLENR